jgi:ribose-phosphate pyrophosphokinase
MESSPIRQTTNAVILSGSAHVSLAEALVRELGIVLGARVLERFPDGEIHTEVLEDVRGRDVFLLQPTPPPVGENLIELLLLSDACQRAGAGRITAVIPYFGYARQDRRSKTGEPFGARVVADALGRGHFACIVTVHLHSPAVEGCFRIPVEHLSAVALLAQAIRAHAARDSVVVSPDLGAVRLAEEYARLLGLPMAIVHKTRVSGSEVSVRGLVGDVRGRPAVIVDDLVSTGGTIAAAAQILQTHGALPDFLVVATHALLVGEAVQRLKGLPLRRFVTTDTLPPKELPFAAEAVGLAPLLGKTIRQLHQPAP